MIKKSVSKLVMVGVFGMATLFSVNAQMGDDPSGIGGEEVVKCYCTHSGGGTYVCKAGNSGTLCASGSESDPNVKCWEYDANC